MVETSVDTAAIVSSPKCQQLGNLLNKFHLKTEDFLDPRFFPPTDADPEDVTRFFFFVTSIDHRTSPPGKSFEGLVDGEYFHGADLLWHLCLRKFKQKPWFFHPSKMAKISTKEIKDWLTVDQPKSVTIRKPAQRAALLRFSGKLLSRKYQNSVLALLKAARNQVVSEMPTSGPGLLDLLSEFKAYEDPVSKKSLLLIKFLLRRNLWKAKDLGRVQIPVDNHLLRIALRIGLVRVSGTLANLLECRIPFTIEMDTRLRERISRAYSIVGIYAKRSVIELDDFFWHFGRQCCTFNTPVCVLGCTSKCYVAQNLLDIPCHGTCPLRSVCLAYNDDRQRALVEPKLETWYY